MEELTLLLKSFYDIKEVSPFYYIMVYNDLIIKDIENYLKRFPLNFTFDQAEIIVKSRNVQVLQLFEKFGLDLFIEEDNWTLSDVIACIESNGPSVCVKEDANNLFDISDNDIKDYLWGKGVKYKQRWV